jgi:hypothetical protein
LINTSLYNSKYKYLKNEYLGYPPNLVSHYSNVGYCLLGLIMDTPFGKALHVKDPVKNGTREGIVQACHGKVAPLKRMRQGDFVVYYSGKENFGRPDKCQEFTAIGKGLRNKWLNLT